MSSYFVVVFATILISGLCLLGMAVGMLLRGKSFTSCACASIMFDGEKIECPGCVPEERSDGDSAKQKRCTGSREVCNGEQSCWERTDCQVELETTGSSPHGPSQIG